MLAQPLVLLPTRQSGVNGPNEGSDNMSDNERCTSSTSSAPKRTDRRLLQIGIASAVAAGILAADTTAQARTTQITILSRGTAFGGYSFPGVGQYEVITGIATGEIDPNDPNNAVITDIELAPRNPNGRVTYQHNFYILKPLHLSNGNKKMMY
jgi:hypothetical protein